MKIEIEERSGVIVRFECETLHELEGFCQLMRAWKEENISEPDMDETKETGWITWVAEQDSKCPVDPHTMVNIRLNNGHVTKAVMAMGVSWGIEPSYNYRIKAYKVLG